jgi:hypothetical protein
MIGYCWSNRIDGIVIYIFTYDKDLKAKRLVKYSPTLILSGVLYHLYS